MKKHTIAATVTTPATRVTSLVITLAVFALTMVAMPALAAEDVVNINEADASQLALLPRIGPSLAGRIVEYREENGPFKSTEDLMLVSGIGEKTYELLGPFTTVSGESTLGSKISVSQAQEAAAKARGKEKDDGDDRR